MGRKLYLFVFFFLFSYVNAWAKEVTDTLESSRKDRVIVTYVIKEDNGQITIQFLNPRILLGNYYRNQYKRRDEIFVLFFDRTGNYEDGIEFSGINTDAFMIPKEVKYKASFDGFFLLDDKPSLAMEIKSDENAVLSIPIFIAHYEKKRHYKVFSRCEDLVINIKPSKRKTSKTQEETAQQFTIQTITSQEVEEPNNDAELANFLIGRIRIGLAEQEDLPFSTDLEQNIAELRKLQLNNVSDHDLTAKIEKVLAECNQKEKELKGNANAASEAIAKEAERRAKQLEEQERARQDSIATAIQKKEDENRKNNLWLIIGGVILAILVFIGNQAFQHFRNVKNKKDILKMQQDAVKRAEEEAKRRARNIARSQVNNVRGETRRKISSSINSGMNKIAKKGKGNKGISI